MFCHTFSLQYHEIVDWLHIGIQLKVLTFPDKAFSHLMDSLSIWVGLLEQRIIQIVADLALSLYLFIGRHPFFGGQHIHILAIPSTSSESYLTARVCHQISLCYLAFDAVSSAPCVLFICFLFIRIITKKLNRFHRAN